MKSAEESSTSGSDTPAEEEKFNQASTKEGLKGRKVDGTTHFFPHKTFEHLEN